MCGAMILSDPTHTTSGPRVGRIPIERRVERDQLRIPDTFLRGPAFITESIHSSTESPDFDLQGTGFWVGYPSKTSRTGASFLYFVTAKHVIDDLRGRSVVVLVNSKDGGVQAVSVKEQDWYFHPS